MGSAGVGCGALDCFLNREGLMLATHQGDDPGLRHNQ